MKTLTAAPLIELQRCLTKISFCISVRRIEQNYITMKAFTSLHKMPFVINLIMPIVVHLYFKPVRVRVEYIEVHKEFSQLFLSRFFFMSNINIQDVELLV